MPRKDAYTSDVHRNNLARLDYMRQELAREFDAIDDSVSGTITVEVNVLRGVVGKVRTVRIRHQQE